MIDGSLEAVTMAMKLVRQNFALATIYNIVSLPLALAGLRDPSDCNDCHVVVFHLGGSKRAQAFGSEKKGGGKVRMHPSDHVLESRA